MLADAYARDWPELHPRPSQTSNDQHRWMVRSFGRHFAGRELRDISRAEARAFAVANPGAARYVRTMFFDALEDGLVESNPFANLRLPQSKGRKHLVIPTTDELRQLQIAAKAPLDTMIPFAAYTGLRVGEHLAVRLADIEADIIHVAEQLNKKSQRRRLKTPASIRDVFIPVEADATLQLPRKGRVWPLSRSQHYRMWDAARCAVGLEHVDWHDLRHHCATWYLEAGASPMDVAILLGHEDDTEVRTLYGHPNKEKALGRLRRLVA